MKRHRDDEVLSESDVDEEYQKNSDQDDEDEYETAHQAQIKMKKKMIKKLKEDLKNQKVENVDEEIRKTYEEEALELQGKVMKDVAKFCSLPDDMKVKLYKCKHDVTCLTYSIDGKFIYTGSKTGDIIKWDALTGKSLVKVKGGRRYSKHKYHCSRVTAIAACDEFVATGDVEKKLFIWNTDLVHQKTLLKHRKEITSLAFRRGSQQLFSGDKKGIIFVWDMALMNTIEELLGHTSEITGLDSNLANNCLSSSGIGDPCVKLWKLDSGSIVSYTLPKKSHEFSLECLSMLNERFFVAGSAHNKIYLWDGVNKKSPIDVVDPAHDLPTDSKLVTTKEIMVVSICALRNTMVFASGSNLSEVKLWNLVQGNGDNFVIRLLFVLPNVVGCINGLRFSPDGKDLAVANSDEHKRFRMQERCPGAKSSVTIYNLFK